jgi:hypothetical protein
MVRVFGSTFIYLISPPHCPIFAVLAWRTIVTISGLAGLWRARYVLCLITCPQI